MKKFLLLAAILLVLVSCTAQNENDRLFCKKLGFDMDDGKLHMTARLASSGKSTPESGKDKLVTRVADTPEKAVEMLEAEFDNILFKPLEGIVFGTTVDKATVFELVSLMVNHREFQLKCNIYLADNAKEAVKNKSRADENEGVSFSRFFRNMTEG